MDSFKKILLIFSFITFLQSIVLIVMNFTFYNNNKEMFFNSPMYTKEYVLIDSTHANIVGFKTKRTMNYGFSKEFDNYKTIFDLNASDRNALFGNKITVKSFNIPLNNSSFHCNVWVNREKQKGYICNDTEKSIKENWIFLRQIFFIRLNIGLIIFTLIIFYWNFVEYLKKKTRIGKETY
jgi:hypothetical protein